MKSSSLASKEQTKSQVLLSNGENKFEFYRPFNSHHKSNSLSFPTKEPSDFLLADSLNANSRGASSLLFDSRTKRLSLTLEQRGPLASMPHLPKVRSNKNLSTKATSQFHTFTKADRSLSPSKQSSGHVTNRNEDAMRNTSLTPQLNKAPKKHFRLSQNFEARTPGLSNENTQSDFSKLPAPTATEIYLANRKKYLPGIFSPGFNNSPKPERAKEALFNLNRIKEELKVRKSRTYAPAQDVITLQKLKMVQQVNRESQNLNLTKEPDLKISILKRKIAINSMFSMQLKNKASTVEERKQMYKNLLLEFHPDKKKHDKEIAEEICNYLVINKQLFIDE